MKANKYQEEIKKFYFFPEDEALTYATLGLTGEAGEVADKVKKIIRDEPEGHDRVTAEMEIMKELGDVAFYLATVATVLGYPLDHILKRNIDKLQDRKDRGMLSGSGDNR